MSTNDDYAAQAAEHVASAEVKKLDVDDWVDPDGKPWRGWTVFMPALNLSVDVGAYDEDDARSKAAAFVANRLQPAVPVVTPAQEIAAAIDAAKTPDDALAALKDWAAKQ